VPMLDSDLPILGAGLPRGAPPPAFSIGEHPVFVEPGAVVEPNVCFDASSGPILLRAGSHVQAFTRLVGPLYVGQGSTLTTDRIAASSIGDVCKVHGEVSNTIFIGHANKGHDGFVGHSILGRWVNLGAGTITSNLKNTYGTVQLWTPDGVRETGLQFLGTLFGDHAKTGIGLRLTTGTVLGAGANVYGSAMPPKAVAPFSWGEAEAFSDYRPDKFLEVASRMMARRHVTLGDGARRQLLASYELRWSADA
jgi:UDP-N-acetylglucosamine diphosphorylase / glucose-1-phosphate thymidylyltransferase / UDP-N-acetylgalactosamine diphosphorylase / glucosamine-1-phosphate N-acetyltransferase / galactosamine-1-phosphate N-acetyltransferase